jgi:Holliday junction DNA helicase RuvA
LTRSLSMIGYLKGQLLEVSSGAWTVVNSGVGYLVHVPKSVDYETRTTSEGVELFVHTHVREDALDLYGFLSRAEKELFLTFLSMNGVGPKLALSLLSNASPSALLDALLSGDKEALTGIPGIGKKTAERMFLELVDPLKKKMEAGAFSQFRTSGARSAAVASSAGALDRALRQELREALLGLGYRDAQISFALEQISGEPLSKTEDALVLALKHLSLGAST